MKEKLDVQATEGGDDASGKKGWSLSKDERQSLLQKRRDDMILAARKKMAVTMEKEADTRTVL